MTRTDDPYYDFLMLDAEQTEWLESLEKCELCGEPIQDEMHYYINEMHICKSCMDGFLVITEGL